MSSLQPSHSNNHPVGHALTNGKVKTQIRALAFNAGVPNDERGTLDKLVEEIVSLTPDHPETDNGTLPDIQCNGRELRDISADAVSALAQKGNIFVRSGELVRVKIDEKNHATIEPVNEAALCGIVCRAANFYTLRMKDGEAIRTITAPPMVLVRDILTLTEWPFRPIEGVIESPTMRPDGTILCTQGYDAATCLYYWPVDDLQLPAMPESPTQADAQAALKVMRELFIDFPFEDEASADNAIATALTIVARPMINAPVAVPLYDASQQGTGKTLAVSTTVLAATGETPDLSPAPKDPDEWRKTITAKLSTGKPVIVIDNLTNTLEDGALANVTTAMMWSDRQLGSQKNIRLPARAIWAVTGNNIRVGGDLVTRCYQIRLDAKTSRPQERTGFAHEDIEAHVRANRGALVAAMLTMCRAWIVAGKPMPECPRHRFKAWRDTIGGILEYAGAKNFLGNMRAFYESADDDGPIWEAFITKLAEMFGGMDATPGMVFARFAGQDDLTQYVPSDLAISLGDINDNKAKAKFTQALGYEFRARKGKRFGDAEARVEVAAKGTKGKGGATWRFVVDRSEDQ